MYVKEQIDNQILWYTSLVLTNQCVIVDYLEFENNYNYVYKKLNLLEVVPNVTTYKTPGTNSDWISNWREIQECVKDINCNPSTYLTNQLN